MASAQPGINEAIQMALGNTGGEEGGSLPASSPIAAAEPAQGAHETFDPTSPFEEGYDPSQLSPEEQAAYRHWQGAYTKSRQKDAERLRELEERAALADQIPPEALDYTRRVQMGDIQGAAALLAQQQQMLGMMGGQMGAGDPAFARNFNPSPGYPPPGYAPPGYAPPGYAPDPLAYEEEGGAYDPVRAELAQIRASQEQESQRRRLWEMGQELSALQVRMGAISPIDQQKMLSIKFQNPGLSMEQVYNLAFQDRVIQRERERVRAEIERRMAAGSHSPPPPAGVPQRTAPAPAPTDRRGIIAAAVAEALRGG